MNKQYVDLGEDDLVDLVVRVDFKNLLEVGHRVVVVFAVEHLGLLNLIHEGAVAVGIGDNNAGLSGESVGDDDVVHLLEKKLLGVFDVGLVLLGQELLNFTFALSVVRHLEVSLANVNDVLSYLGIIPCLRTHGER